MALTEEQRRSRSRLAAHIQWSREPDRTGRTQAMRDGFLAKLERQVDPNGIYTPEQRAKMVEAARKAFYIRLGRATGKARRAKAAKKAGGDGTA
jgi:hypothetical protein